MEECRRASCTATDLANSFGRPPAVLRQEVPMKLYDFPFSPNCRKVRAVAYELGIALEHVPVDLLKGESRTPAFLAMNPNGRVPVLEDGDFDPLGVDRDHPLPRGRLRARAGRAARRRRGRSLDRVAARAPRRRRCRKVAFERIVKRLTGRGAPDPARDRRGHRRVRAADRDPRRRRSPDASTSPARSRSPTSRSRRTTAWPPALRSRRSPRTARVESWLARMLARDSMKRALADAATRPA